MCEGRPLPGNINTVEPGSGYNNGSAHQKPPLPGIAVEKVWDSSGHRIPAVVSGVDNHSSMIVVREADFRRYGHDLKKLRQCQVPKWREPAKLLSKQERYELACRSQTEFRDPWDGLGNPEALRPSAEGDLTLNQLWAPPPPNSAKSVIAQENPPRRWRSQSEDTTSRRHELLDVVLKVAQPLNLSRVRSGNSSHSTGSRSTSARSCGSRGSSCTLDTHTSNTSSRVDSGSGSRTEILGATARSRRGRARSHSREPSAAPSQRGERPPRAPVIPGAGAEVAATRPVPPLVEAEAPAYARRVRSGSAQPLFLTSARSTLPPLPATASSRLLSPRLEADSEARLQARLDAVRAGGCSAFLTSC